MAFYFFYFAQAHPGEGPFAVFTNSTSIDAPFSRPRHCFFPHFFFLALKPSTQALKCENIQELAFSFALLFFPFFGYGVWRCGDAWLGWAVKAKNSLTCI